MSKLLRADFARLLKSKVFWFCLLFVFLSEVFSSVGLYRETKSITGYLAHCDSLLFDVCAQMIIIAAIFSGLFVGTDYSNGTIRNKIIVGHTRTEIYLSNLIVCSSALLIIQLVGMLTAVGIGFPLVGNMEKSFLSLFVLSLISFATTIALSALFLLIAMMIHSKAHSVVAAIIVAIVLLIGAFVIGDGLNQPEYTSSVTVSVAEDGVDNSDNQMVMEKNPYYISGAKRDLYEFLYDFLPGCQMMQISEQNPEHPARLPVYSLSIILATTACGVLLFRKKDIK